MAQEGFLERHRKTGTRVVMPEGRSANFEIPRIRLEIEETGATYRYALLLLEVTVQFDFRWRNLKNIPEAEQEKFEE
ncbi:MAG: GntR family transcriptional regulator, partial [SAR324 cluster bacterium]|nr:GntR family transcriptional regulator [SAR324 cluster bacterium]